MNRQSLFKYGAVAAVLLSITMYSYFWYSAGTVGFGFAFRQVLWGIFVTLGFAWGAVAASTSQYLERKHSLIFFGISSFPILIGLLLLNFSGGEIVDFAVGFAYSFLVLFAICSMIYFISIFAKK